MNFVELGIQQEAIRLDLDRRISTVLQHGQYIMGPEVAELEVILANFVGVSNCTTVSSGTEALLIALMAIGIGPGDEVITPSFTFVATAEVIALLGGVPVFVDVDPQTANIDAEQIAAKITDRTKAIIPVSLFGQPADMNEINAIAAASSAVVIEDAAQSFGACYGNRRSGALSPIGTTSFFPSKPLGCYGDGGALFTDDQGIANAAREIRIHGQSSRYIHTRIGVGGRMDTLQCAILLAKWPRFAWEIDRRKYLGQRYTDLILGTISGSRTVSRQDVGGKLDGIRTLGIRPGRESVFAQYTILVPDRDRVQDELRQRGIPSAVHYPLPLSSQPAYRHWSDQEFPVAAWLSDHVLSVPMSADLCEKDQDWVVDSLRSLVLNRAK